MHVHTYTGKLHLIYFIIEFMSRLLSVFEFLLLLSNIVHFKKFEEKYAAFFLCVKLQRSQHWLDSIMSHSHVC